MPALTGFAGRLVLLWAISSWAPAAEDDGWQQQSYRNQFKIELGQDVLDDIRLSVNTGFVLGSKKFHEQVEEVSGIPQTFQQRGRPPNVKEL